MKDIAKAIGIKNSSLYKHYTSKKSSIRSSKRFRKDCNAQNRLSVPDKANAAFAYANFGDSQARGSFLYGTMLPADPRRQGVIVDRDITNIEMTLNNADYPVEELKNRS